MNQETLSKQLGPPLYGLTQAALAMKAKVTQAWSPIWKAGRKNPSLVILRRLAKALNITVAELVK